MTIPKYVFIVPYRNREEHKHFFLRYMKYILEDYPSDDYEIIFSHQCDNRPFNRGAVKNIGFKYVKHKYENDYKNINFIFHDIDVMPYKKNLLNYETQVGTIKHYYGFKYALGGIISIKGSDFDLLNGFPNYWSWSLEDNCFQERALYNNIKIDRNTFYQIGDHHILHIHDGYYKDLSKTNIDLYQSDSGNEGLETIYRTQLKDEIINGTDTNIKHTFCNIRYFETLYSHDSQIKAQKHDLRNGNKLGLRSNGRQMNTLIYNK